MAKKTPSAYITKKDLENLVTKEELKMLEIRLGLNFDEKFEEMDGKGRGYRDDVLNGLDKVMKELEAIWEDNEVGTHQVRELREEVDGHEKRITKLESSN